MTAETTEPRARRSTSGLPPQPADRSVHPGQGAPAGLGRPLAPRSADTTPPDPAAAETVPPGTARPSAGGPSLAAGLPLLITAVFAMNAGMGMQSATYTNFAVDLLHINAAQLGAVEAIRESSGVLCFLVAALAARMALPLLAGAALCLMGIGMIALGHAHSIPWLAAASFAWGLGFHTFSPINPSLSMQMATDHAQRAGLLGKLSGVGALAGPVGTLAVLALLPLLGLRGEFLPAGLLCVAAGLAMFFVRNPRPGPRPRLVLRRAYLPYYLLTLADGGRKQVLITFVVFAVVSVYHASVVTVSLLLLCSSLLCMLASPYVGRWIATYGERRVVVLSSLLLVPLFAGYGLTSSETVMIALYLVDNTLFTANVALTTWVGRHAPPEEVAPTLAVGTTVNHISSVIVPLAAGFLWQAYGYRDIFFGGAGIALITLLLALRVLPAVEAAA